MLLNIKRIIDIPQIIAQRVRISQQCFPAFRCIVYFFRMFRKVAFLENNNRIREVEVRSSSGGMYLIKFPETGGGIKLKESRLFATKEEAQKSVHGYKPKTPYDYM